MGLGVIAVVSWVGITGSEELAMLKRLLPGGLATELVVNAWNGGVAITDSLILLAPTLAWGHRRGLPGLPHVPLGTPPLTTRTPPFDRC